MSCELHAPREETGALRTESYIKTKTSLLHYTLSTQVLALKVLWPIKIISDLCLLLQWSEGKGCKVKAELIIRGRTRESDVDGGE